jgi:hypothetical protein
MQSPGAYQWREDNDEFEEDSGKDFFVAGGGGDDMTLQNDS